MVYLQGSGKLEKAEILEKTVEYLKTLKSHLTELQEKNIKVEGEHCVIYINH